MQNFNTWMFSIFGAGDEVYRKYDYISKHVNRDELSIYVEFYYPRYPCWVLRMLII
jgi:hypothetical protein